MVVCWRYAEARAFEPFEDEELPDGKEPNELRIGLFQATGLAVKDKALLFVPQSPIASRSTPHAIDAVDTRPTQVGRGLVGPAHDLHRGRNRPQVHVGDGQEESRPRLEASDDPRAAERARRRSKATGQVRRRRRGLGC